MRELNLNYIRTCSVRIKVGPLHCAGAHAAANETNPRTAHPLLCIPSSPQVELPQVGRLNTPTCTTKPSRAVNPSAASTSPLTLHTRNLSRNAPSHALNTS